MTIKQEKPPSGIGTMNGPWAILLKVMLSTYPFILAWSSWVTVETIVNREFRIEAKDHIKTVEGLEFRLINYVDSKTLLASKEVQTTLNQDIKEIKNISETNRSILIENGVVVKQLLKEMEELKREH